MNTPSRICSLILLLTISLISSCAQPDSEHSETSATTPAATTRVLSQTSLSPQQIYAVRDMREEEPDLDFSNLLTDADPVAICTETMTQVMDKQVGPYYLPENFESHYCHCQKALVQRQAQSILPERADMAAALVQLTANFYQLRLSRLDAPAHRTLSAVTTYEARPQTPYTDSDVSAASKIPACETAMQVFSQHLPGHAPEVSVFALEQTLAQQRLKFDQNISMMRIDGLLTQAKPERQCPKLMREMIDAVNNHGGEAGSPDDAETHCANIFNALEQESVHLTPAEQLFLKRTILASVYAESRRTTSQENDIDDYITSQMKIFGYSDERAAVMLMALQKAGETYAAPLSAEIARGTN